MASNNNVKIEYVSGKRPEDTVDLNWYKQETPHESVFGMVNKIDEDQSYRHALNVKHARLYNNLEMLGLNVSRNGTAGSVNPQDISSGKITHNLVKSCIDTASSKIAKNRPKPQFLTSGGDYKAKQKAELLTKYIEGVFYSTDYYVQASKIFIDGCVFGTGVLKIYIEEGQIKCERVIPEEIKVDDADGLYGKPKSMYQIKQITRETLSEMYPDHKIAIDMASSSTPDHSNVDLIRVVEAWHLGSKVGRHTICIENATLFDEEWKKDYFPFVFYRWNDRLTGFFGSGLAEELVGTQIEINRTLRNIQLAQKLVAVPRIAVESNSKVSVAQLTNEIGSVIKYQAGTRPPVFNTPTAMNPEVYQHLKWLIQSGYEKTGISQMSATSRKPAGLDSAVALREYSDIETERFMLTAMKYEALGMEACKIMVDLSRDLFLEDKKLKIKVPGSDFINTISWKDVDLAEDQYIMKVYPVGLLPTHPAGRLAGVQELIQAGWISKDKALELLDFPDLKAYESLETASNTLIEKSIGEMLDTGVYYPPEPQLDLVHAAATANKHYLQGRISGVPEERLELLLRFMDDADRLHTASLPPAPEASLPQGEPLGVGEPLPQSALLPQV